MYVLITKEILSIYIHIFQCGNLPNDIDLEVAMIGIDSENKYYYSLYQVSNSTSKRKDYVNKLRCKAKLEKVGNDVYIIK